MAGVLGIILAGGRGRRLGGVIKANIEIGGIRLIDRISVAVAKQCDLAIVSSGGVPPGQLNPPAHLTEIQDIGDKDAGPVAGLASAVAWAQGNQPEAEFLLTAAVDTPFFPQDFVPRALPLMTDQTDCVTGKEGRQPYPTNSLWRLSALTYLFEADTLPNGLRNVIPAERTMYVDYQPHNPRGCFFNINMPEDIETAERLARTG